MSVLLIAACAVMTGARSYVAICQWAQDLSVSERTELGLDSPVPSESTIRRVLQSGDGDLCDAVLAAWAAARRDQTPQARRAGLRAIAVDGKTCRGARTAKGSAVHLLGAVEHHSGAVLAQTQVDPTTSEVQAFRPLLDHVHYLHRHGARYLFIVKGNQPKLHAQLAALPWAQNPSSVTRTAQQSHGVCGIEGTIKASEHAPGPLRIGGPKPHVR